MCKKNPFGYVAKGVWFQAIYMFSDPLLLCSEIGVLTEGVWYPWQAPERANGQLNGRFHMAFPIGS